jgi:Na+-transporting NADH:ubiquinone oxidoreductase subunit NqrC
MAWLIPYAIAAAVTSVSVAVQYYTAKDRADTVNKLNKAKDRIQTQGVLAEKAEAKRLIDVKARSIRAKVVHREATSREGAEDKSNSGLLQLAAIDSSKEAALSLLESRSNTRLSLNRNAFELSKAQSATPGISELLFTGALDATASGITGVGDSMLEEDKKKIGDIFRNG